MFASDQDGNWEIYLRTRSGEVRLTHDPAQDRDPVLSGNGERIAFSSDRGGNRDIYVMARDGSRLVRLTDAPGDDFSPAWCAGDTQIVFVSRRDGYSDLYAMRADGARQRVLPRTPAAEYEPTWAPGVLARNCAPTALVVASSVGPTQVRFSLVGTWDREEGRRLSGALSFGDGTDTTFARIPARIEHAYRREGTFEASLKVVDSAHQAAFVYLELTLRTDLRVRYRDLTFEKRYQPAPLDR
ncbi:MAG: hypothetical protein AB1505_02200 [Candidatus Latescibacterota bacterium]